MPALQIKDCPVSVYDQLRFCADREDRSISQQMLHILKKYLALYRDVPKTVNDPDEVIFNGSMAREEECRKSQRIEERKEFLDSLLTVEATDLPKGFPSVAEMIREDRESRGVPAELQEGVL